MVTVKVNFVGGTDHQFEPWHDAIDCMKSNVIKFRLNEMPFMIA
jgi:hypothetical protein